MRNLFLFVCILIIFPLTIAAQDVLQSGEKSKDNTVSSEYDRSSMTFYYLNFNENHASAVRQNFMGIDIPEKYYNNTLDTKEFNMPSNREDMSKLVSFATRLDTDILKKVLNSNNTGQKLISKWFNRTNGEFNVDVLKERGMYNASDADYVVAEASKRGKAALMDMGLGLVDKSYVLMFDFSNIMTMAEYYAKNETEAENRTSNGYKGTLLTYLFKLDFNDSVAATFFQDLWIMDNDPNKTAKVAAFESTVFPFKYMNTFVETLTATQLNPDQKYAPKEQKSQAELMKKMVTSGVDNMLTKIENKMSQFRVKAFVHSVKPIAAKIGRKEGLKFDQRYFVYENIQRNSGKMVTKRRGVVKSMKVVDNRIITTGETEPSLFYQTSGKKIDSYGMFMEQKNAVGLNVFLGNTEGGMHGFTLRADYYISTLIYESVVKEGKKKWLTSLCIYLEGKIGSNSTDYYSFGNFSVGLSKEFYPIRNFMWAPFIGYAMESATWENPNDEKISSEYIEFGIRGGINLTHNIQLFGSLNAFAVIASERQDKDGELLYEVEYEDYFDKRNDPGFSYGIRIMF